MDNSQVKRRRFDTDSSKTIRNPKSIVSCKTVDEQQSEFEMPAIDNIKNRRRLKVEEKEPEEVTYFFPIFFSKKGSAYGDDNFKQSGPRDI